MVILTKKRVCNLKDHVLSCVDEEIMLIEELIKESDKDIRCHKNNERALAKLRFVRRKIETALKMELGT